MEATCTGDYGTDVASHAPEARLKGESLDFRRKARAQRRAGVTDSCLLWLSQKDIEGKYRFIYDLL